MNQKSIFIFWVMREWLLIKRQASIWIGQFGFIFLWLNLMPFFCQNHLESLKTWTPILFWFQNGWIWMILADRILKTENLTSWLLSPHGFEKLFWIRVIIYYSVFMISLGLGLFYFKILYHFLDREYLIYYLTALLGMPSIALLTLLSSALMYAHSNQSGIYSGFLTNIFIVPWSIPIYLLGLMTIQFDQIGQSIIPLLVLLASISLCCIAILPRVIIYVLRSHLLAYD